MRKSRNKKAAVIIFSGGVDSVCTASYLKKDYELYGISFLYGQRASKEISVAKDFAKKIPLKQHKIVDINFMKGLYGKSNVLTDSKKRMPEKFDYSIVVPIRNAIFLSIATAWAFTMNASLVAYGAHTGDMPYPDCRPAFARKIQAAFNEGEIDGIKSGLRNKIEVWSPFKERMPKSELLRIGYKTFGDQIFKTWSCYSDGKQHCGICESCNNRKKAFKEAYIQDKTRYVS